MRTTVARVAVFLLAVVASGVAAGQVPDDELLSFLRWRDLGPTVTGGRIVDIAVQPDDHATIYAASASGGLWKTVNGGTTWDCIFHQEGTISIGDIALDPRDPAVIWVGTGEANNQRSSMWGDGIYKTTDGGETWTNMGLTDSHHIGRIVIHPHDSDTVYVAALGHLYTPNEERGLYKTTDGGESWTKVLDLGSEVGIVDVVVNPNNPNMILAASYERLRRAWDFDGAGPGSGIHKSTDGGETWRRLEGGLPEGNIGRIGLAVYPRNPRIVYATVSNQNESQDELPDDSDEDEEEGAFRLPLGMTVKFEDGVCRISAVRQGGMASRVGIEVGDELRKLAGREVTDEWTLTAILDSLRQGDSVMVTVAHEGEERTLSLTMPQGRRRVVGGEVYRSEDGGETWTKRNSRSVGGTPAYYYGQIRIDPNNEQRLYLLSVPLYVSDDGGETWSGNGARSVHVDHHALWINPQNSEHLLLGNDGGFHISHDAGDTWDWVFNLPLSQFYAIGADMQRPYHVYGGTQDNGSIGGPSRSRNPSGIGRFEWYRVGGGDGFYVQVDPSDTDTIYGESQFGVIYRLDRSTGQRVSIRPPQSDPAGAADRYNWNSPILISHHHPQTIYFGGNKLFKSYNRGDDWLVISPDLSTQNPERIAGNVPHCTITTIAESPLDPDVLLVGTDDGNVQWSRDGGENWTNMADRFPLRPSGWWVTRVELSHHDVNTAYVTFSGYREDDFRPFVFATTDGGETWSSLAANLPDAPINVLKEDRENPDLLFVGTDFSVFCSLDRGGKWIELANGLPRVPVHDLVIHSRDRDLIAGTHGRGIFILDDIVVLQELTDEVREKSAHLFSVRPAVRWLRVAWQSISGDRRVYAANPPNGATITYWLSSEPEGEVRLRIRNPEGEVIRQLNSETAPGLHRVVWDLQATRDGQQGPQRRFGRAAVPAGRYVVELQVGDSVQQQELLVEEDPLRP